MSRWKRGDIVVVTFPYTEADGRIVVKGRPALVVSSAWVNRSTQDVIVAAISSRQPAQPYPTDFKIAEGTAAFKRSGLKVSSIVKGTALATLSQTVIARRLGSLGPVEMRQVDGCLRASLQLYLNLLKAES